MDSGEVNISEIPKSVLNQLDTAFIRSPKHRYRSNHQHLVEGIKTVKVKMRKDSHSEGIGIAREHVIVAKDTDCDLNKRVHLFIASMSSKRWMQCDRC